MNDIPDFAEAVDLFRDFLTKTGHSGEVFWVFRDDVWRLSPTYAWVKYPPPAKNASLAKKVFSEGRERGLVEISGIATAAQKVAATIWFPKYDNEQTQGWEGMKMTIYDPLPDAKLVGRLRWQLLRFDPGFQRYQRMEFFIGTKDWAAS